NHALVLHETGIVFSFGNNINGQLGLGNNDLIQLRPKAIPNLNNIIQVATGWNHSLVLSSDGKVYSFGENQFGNLGLGDNVNKNIPTLIQTLNNISQISAGTY